MKEVSWGAGEMNRMMWRLWRQANLKVNDYIWYWIWTKLYYPSDRITLFVCKYEEIVENFPKQFWKLLMIGNL